MRVIDALLLLLLLAVLAVGLYFLWDLLPNGENVKYQSYVANVSASSNSVQFYPNMRYRERDISYHISDACSNKKQNDVETAFLILEEKTILNFYPTDNDPELNILCSSVSPKPNEEGHFVAGEGGPTEIINTSAYSVILSGKISLYRAEKCDEPKIALHEILHALGFDHNNNEGSVLYPVTSCDQQLDEYIIETINELYAVDSLPDLIIGKISANKSGRYLNLEIEVVNIGLANSQDSELIISSNNEEIKRYDLLEIEIGTKKKLSVTNMRLPRDSDSVSFVVETDEREISKSNNDAEITVEGE